jgi:hypothetical protein
VSEGGREREGRSREVLTIVSLVQAPVHFNGDEGVITAIEAEPEALDGAFEDGSVGHIEGEAVGGEEHPCLFAFLFPERGEGRGG